MPTYERQAWAASQGALAAQLLSHVTLCDPRDCSPSVSPVQGISRQQYWSGWPFPTQGIFLTQGSNPCLLRCTWEAHTPASGGLRVSRGRRHSYHLEESGKAGQEVAIEVRR